MASSYIPASNADRGCLMFGNVYAAGGEFVGSIRGNDFCNRRGAKVGVIRHGRVYRPDGSLICTLQREAPAPAVERLSCEEFTRLVEAR